MSHSATTIITDDNHPARKSRQVLVLGLLILILLLGGFLRFYQLGADGYGNMYYAATVKSMLTSWHNFFYASFEPGGSVTVDKPPLGFWLQALSAAILGVNGFALALPQALAGVLSIALIFHLVKRPFGPWAGLIAALALAIIPITIVTERNNTIDGTLVLVLLLSIWALEKAIRSGKFRFLLLSLALVGVGFNIKMLQAYMVLPAIGLTYLVAARHTWWKRLVHLALGAILMAAISLAWVVAFDLTPADERPFAGSSSNNSMLELVIGHNGLSRLQSLRPFAQAEAIDRPQDQNGLPGPQYPGYQAPAGAYPYPRPPIQGGQPLPQYPGGNPLSDNPGQNQPPASTSTRQNEVGEAGWLRLFRDPLDDEAGWLLPLALLAIPLAGVLLNWKKPLEARVTAWLIWSLWLIPMLAYFSFTTGLWHTYYLIMLGPAVAALCGMAVWALGRLFESNRLAGWLATLLICGLTLAYELTTLHDYLPQAGWLIGLAVLLGIAGLVLAFIKLEKALIVATVLLVLSLTLAPLTWSYESVVVSQTDSNLPHAGISNAPPRPVNARAGELSIFQEAVLQVTLDNTPADGYLLVAMNANTAAPYILASGRPVLTLGGFTGSDDIYTLEELIARFASGELRYVLGGSGLAQKDAAFNQWVQRNCQVVPLPGMPALRNQPQQNRDPAPAASQADQLYDCSR